MLKIEEPGEGGEDTSRMGKVTPSGQGIKTKKPLIKPLFTLQKYVSLVTWLAIVFGAAFQMPLVVYFLARSGLVPIEVLRKYRKIVILIIVFTAGILAPPDLFSHLLLSGPMILLFELGLLLAARKQSAAARA